MTGETVDVRVAVAVVRMMLALDPDSSSVTVLLDAYKEAVDLINRRQWRAGPKSNRCIACGAADYQGHESCEVSRVLVRARELGVTG